MFRKFSQIKNIYNLWKLIIEKLFKRIWWLCHYFLTLNIKSSFTFNHILPINGTWLMWANTGSLKMIYISYVHFHKPIWWRLYSMILVQIRVMYVKEFCTHRCRLMDIRIRCISVVSLNKKNRFNENFADHRTLVARYEDMRFVTSIWVYSHEKVSGLLWICSTILQTIFYEIDSSSYQIIVSNKMLILQQNFSNSFLLQFLISVFIYVFNFCLMNVHCK